MTTQNSIEPIATLIFDGDCGFCTSSANRVKARLGARVAIVPWQWADLSGFGISESQAADRVWLVEGDERFGGHRAFARILQLDRNWIVRLVGSLLVLPGISCLAAGGYRMIARYRHKLPGGTPACQLKK